MVAVVIHIAALGAAGMGTGCLDGDVALAGDGSGLVSNGQHGVPCPVSQTLVQNGIQGRTFHINITVDSRTLTIFIQLQGQFCFKNKSSIQSGRKTAAEHPDIGII